MVFRTQSVGIVSLDGSGEETAPEPNFRRIPQLNHAPRSALDNPGLATVASAKDQENQATALKVVQLEEKLDAVMSRMESMEAAYQEVKFLVPKVEETERTFSSANEAMSQRIKRLDVIVDSLSTEVCHASTQGQEDKEKAQQENDTTRSRLTSMSCDIENIRRLAQKANQDAFSAQQTAVSAQYNPDPRVRFNVGYMQRQIGAGAQKIARLKSMHFRSVAQNVQELKTIKTSLDALKHELPQQNTISQLNSGMSRLQSRVNAIEAAQANAQELSKGKKTVPRQQSRHSSSLSNAPGTGSSAVPRTGSQAQGAKSSSAGLLGSTPVSGSTSSFPASSSTVAAAVPTTNSQDTTPSSTGLFGAAATPKTRSQGAASSSLKVSSSGTDGTGFEPTPRTTSSSFSSGNGSVKSAPTIKAPTNTARKRSRSPEEQAPVTKRQRASGPEYTGGRSAQGVSWTSEDPQRDEEL